MRKHKITIIIITLSVLIIFLGNWITTSKVDIFYPSYSEMYKAVVTEVTKDIEGPAEDNDIVEFTCKIISGERKGETVSATQSFMSMYGMTNIVTKPVDVGDRIQIVSENDMSVGNETWYMNDYYRVDGILVLLVAFMFLVIMIGRGKGISTILSMTFTFGFVFFVFVPAIMSGANIYLWTIFTCIFTIITTLVLIGGASKKTLATIIGCSLGTMIAGFCTFMINRLLLITGYIDDDSLYLGSLLEENQVDFSALVFAAITIGALGALMDIAMDLSSALYEINEKAPNISMKELCKSGMNIGRDVMGTMANTLILAYIGGSLTSTMLIMAYSMSLGHLLNRELIIVELMKAIIGSTAILLTIPCTVIVCGILYKSRLKSDLVFDDNSII